MDEPAETAPHVTVSRALGSTAHLRPIRKDAFGIEAAVRQSVTWLEHLKVKAGAGFSRQQAEDPRRSVTVDYTWSGGAPDVEAARQLLRDTNLQGDDALTSLIRLRANVDNEHRELVETFDLPHGSSSTIELAAELKAGLTGGKAKGARSRKGRYEYKVSDKITY